MFIFHPDNKVLAISDDNQDWSILSGGSMAAVDSAVPRGLLGTGSTPSRSQNGVASFTSPRHLLGLRDAQVGVRVA